MLMLKDRVDLNTLENQSDTMPFKSIAVRSKIKDRIKKEKGEKTYSEFLEDLLDKKSTGPILEENKIEGRIARLWKNQKELEGKLLRLEAKLIKRYKSYPTTAPNQINPTFRQTTHHLTSSLGSKKRNQETTLRFMRFLGFFCMTISPSRAKKKFCFFSKVCHSSIARFLHLHYFNPEPFINS